MGGACRLLYKAEVDDHRGPVLGLPRRTKPKRAVGGIQQHLPGAQIELRAVAVADEDAAVDDLAVAHERAAGVRALAIGGRPPVRVADQRELDAIDPCREDGPLGRHGVDVAATPPAMLGRHASQTTGRVFAARTIHPWTTGSRSGSSRRLGRRVNSSSTDTCATCRAT